MSSSSSENSRPLAALLLALLLPSCATMVSDAQTLLRIDATERAATVRVLDHHDLTVFEGVTPCEVEVENAAGFWQGASYTVEVEKDGFSGRRIELASDIDPAFYGNAFLPGGLIGSLLIDPLSGAMFQLEFEELVIELDLLDS